MLLRKKSYVSGACFGRLFSGLALALAFGCATATAVAGDLLRGGYTGVSGAGGAAPGSFTAPSVTQARQSAQDVLSRTTQALQAMKSMQGAARKLALAGANNLTHAGQALPAVPNGLNTGGLVPDSGLAGSGVSNPVTTWVGAGTPTQTVNAKGRTIVDIQQTAADAILNWTTFNIGKGTTLDINQSKGGQEVNSWIAFNIVRDPSGVPSQILGSIEAPGQVYVINQNGIIFGGSSQVNVHGLVASSLPIDSYLIGHGLLNNPDDQFLFSALAQPSGANGSPAFTPPVSFAPGGADGDVIVEPGALLSAPTNADHVGGRVALIGPNVENEGTISTPDGQTILAAGLQVGFTAHPSTDATLRGLDVYVGAISNPSYPAAATAGLVENSGFIFVPRGDTTMAGANVEQLGVIGSTTSVTLNGRIDLLADYGAVSSGGVATAAPFLPKDTGEVEMGAGSVTEILPEWGSTDRVVGTSLALASIVRVQGLAVHMASGAQLFAPSADVSVDAGIWDYLLQGSLPVDTFVHSTGQIYLDAGATIDVQGSWDVSAPVSENIISVQLLGPQLADSPSQRTGPFVGQTLMVDIRDAGVYDGQAWVGTPLADTSGYVGLIERTVGELTTAGGTVNLDAGGSVVMKAGSQVNVSGGWIDYQGGVVQTSEVISGGHIYPISQATPDLVYAGFSLGTYTVNHPTYGLSATYVNPLLDNAHYEDSYIQGFDGGTVSITSPATALDGQFLGNTVAGPRQRQVLPAPSQFDLSFLTQRDIPTSFPTYSPTPPNVVFSFTDDLPAASHFALDNSGNPLPLSADREKNVVLSPDLVGSDGFGVLSINNGDGDISVPSSVTLRTEPEGSIILTGANIDIAGSIFAPGGSLSFTVYDFTPYNVLTSLTQIPPVDPTRGHFILGSGATLSTAGLVVDDRPGASDAGEGTLATSGGSITIKSFSADLSAGSFIDVSGGVQMTDTGKPVYGNAGKISIAAGQDPGISPLLGGSFILDSVLTGYSGAEGGSLSLLAQLVQVGGVASHPDTLLLSPAFFDQGGFASFTLTGLGGLSNTANEFIPGVLIAPGTEIDPVVTSVVAMASGQDINLVPALLPLGVRPPVNLVFKAAGVTNAFNSANSLLIRGDLVMGLGSVIRTDPGGSVTESGNTVAVLGSIIAPAGTITISGGQNSLSLFAGTSAPVATVDLGPESLLSTAGVTVLTANNMGYRTGSVLGGGSITVSGNIVAEAGAVLDVSGATGILDLSPVQGDVNASLGGAPEAAQNGSFMGKLLVPTQVDSNGGTITLNGAQELFTDATLRGAAGGPSALGGSLFVSSGVDIPDQSALDPTLFVTQGGVSIPAPFYAAGQDAIGHAVVDKHGNAITPMGYFAVDSFAAGGFGSLDLAGSVQFSGPVSITAKDSLTVATGGVIFANAPVSLTADLVTLGLAFRSPTQPQLVPPTFTQENSAFHFDPTYGPASLTVTANLIDIGSLSLQGIGAAKFFANAIQGDGTLDVAGSIFMQAGQVFVPTDVPFTIAAYDYQANGSTHAGSVTFAASGGVPQLPLSAGGVLSVYGSIINQDGILRAPLGFINLGWNGSGAAPIDPITGQAVDATQQLTLGKGSITSVSAVDPLTGVGEVIPYGTDLNGTSWIDPAGIDITAGGIPQKAISISAVNVNALKGSDIDIQGGGDIMAYRFISGVGGTQDIVGSPTSFAILPGYQASYAPYDTAFSDGAKLAVGDEIYLKGSSTLPAGDYTLLPASYALLAGGILVTPESTAPNGVSVTLPDGGSLVSGYRFNTSETAAPLATSFELDPAGVIRERAQYEIIYGDTFLSKGAALNNQPVPRLPKDSGQLAINAANSLVLAGMVTSTPLQGGQGGLVDIASPENIVIAGPGFTQAGALVLDAAELDTFNAASLLIGGIRQTGPNGTSITVTSDQITVDNAGSPLTGEDIILAANDGLTLDPGAVIESSGPAAHAGEILVNGNGVLVRVSSDSSATVARSGVTNATAPLLDIGNGVKISGASVTLDSSSATSLDPGASITGKAINLDSGQVTIELPGAGAVAPTTGLVLAASTLQTLQNTAKSLSILSYSSIDFYGAGQFGALNSQGQPTLQELALHAAEIRGFNTGGGAVTLDARNILLDNSPHGSDPGATAAPAGSLVMNADTVELGANAVAIDQFATVDLNGSGGIIAGSSPGSFAVQGALNLSAPLITGAKGANEIISAGGALSLLAPAGAASPSVTPGLGASLTFLGATVTDNTSVSLPSGSLTLHATTGDLTIGNLAAATLDVSGQAKTFFDLTKYTSGGKINLVADQGSVSIGSGAVISVAAQSGGGNAGMLEISSPEGTLGLDLAASLAGQGGAGGQAGSFILDVGSLPSLASIDASLDAAGFDQSRNIRVRTGSVTVDGLATSANFNLSADGGDITVSGEINGSGETGGAISLQAEGSVTLLSTAQLTVAAQNFNDAGQGGSVDLEAGSNAGGAPNSAAVVDIQTGSTIDLSVAAGAGEGDRSGVLHLRAPQTAGNTDLQVNPINGTITGASGITVEGYVIYNTAADGGSIDDQEGNVYANGQIFAGNTAAISTRLLANNPGLASVLTVEPGAEIINPAGDLTLGGDWDLAPFRFGPDNVPGDLTLRAAGNVVLEFGASLSDGFDANGGLLWDAPLLAVGEPSWSYRIVAGADLTAADYRQVTPLAGLAANEGSLQLGAGSPNLSTVTIKSRSTVLAADFETIRTGAGSIEIYAGRDVQLLDPLATIYSAGTQAPDLANFTRPNVTYRNSQLGTAQTPLYPPEYTEDGGSVTIVAQNDIEHLVANSSGGESPDSSLELPDNWLYRQGGIDPTTGQFTSASTSWWSDFSNFVEGVAAFGGGNVTLNAGNDISNVDAAIPTNARMPNGVPNAANLLELGGGDLAVVAGGNISGGVYYVERGSGVITAGGQIETNSTRATLSESQVNINKAQGVTPDSSTWLPTTLFAGNASFDISAGGDVLLGPVVNPFLLPQGINNSYLNRSYFSTYAASDAVNVQSLSGDVTIKDSADAGETGSLLSFLTNVDSPSSSNSFAVISEPWLRTVEPQMSFFSTVAELMPSTLRVTAFSGSIDLVGSVLLSPAPEGTVDLLAAGSINALQPNGLDLATGLVAWGTGIINLSDANPASIPGITTPLSPAQQSPIPQSDPLQQLDDLFAETGATEGGAGVIQVKEALHAAGLLHANDPTPAHLYAAGGNISGLTLFSSKFTRVIAGQDITDASLYVQDVAASDISVVSAARDIIPYDPNSPLRVEAQAAGNELINAIGVTEAVAGSGTPTAGDIQISGPGTLEVLAGRNLTLGSGPNNQDGTAVGITSIGNGRNPYLPFDGAQVLVAAGLGGAADGLNESNLDITSFISQILGSAGGSTYFADLAMTDPTLDVSSLAQLKALPAGEQAVVALDLFYLVLRDAGRNHNLPGTAGFGNYSAGLAAIAALLPSSHAYSGDIDLTSKEIKTESGGDIDLLAPGGQLTVGIDLAGSQPVDQGILTEDGGNVSIYTEGDVNIGTSRIFTLRGGNEIIWSNAGNIAAGESAKTVQSAPPTRVLIDPQSADVETDLAGLATGGGIGVLASVANVAPGSVDLIAPTGVIDAGDAGIRATGNLNLAAVQVLNASNIQAGGASTGVPTVTVAAPNLAGLAAASSAVGATTAAANEQTASQQQTEASDQGGDSVITVDVIGYGGGDPGDSGG